MFTRRNTGLRRNSAAIVSYAIMVFIITAAPSFASDYVPPKVDTTTPYGVNLADGSFIYSVTDLSIGSLNLDRFHLGGIEDPDAPFFGPRMSHNFDIFIAKNFKSIGNNHEYDPVVHMGLGSAGPYEDNPAYSSILPLTGDGYSGTLTKNGSAYVYTAQDGTIYTFNPNVAALNVVQGGGSQRIDNIVYPNGRTLTFSYDSAANLKEVADNMGYALVFDYNTDHTVAAACGFDLAIDYVTPAKTCSGAVLKTTYGYSNGLLTRSTDATGAVTNYQYQGNEISCIQPPGYAACKIANSYSGFQVVSQTLADGSVWKFAYTGSYTDSRDPDPSGAYNGNYTTDVTDPAGKISHYIFTQSSPNQMVDANSHQWNYTYSGGGVDSNQGTSLNAGSELDEVVYPEGNKYDAQYAGPYSTISQQTWTAKPNSGTPTASVQFQYPATCSGSYTRQNCTKPIARKDPNGNQTDYVYSGFGAPQSEMQPAPTSGSARPLKLYTYVQKYAYLQNASGALVAANTSVWLPSTETQCQTAVGSSTPTCDTAAQQLVTTYEYGANGTADNLLVRGRVMTADGKAYRTCYRYDGVGNKIAETSPRAGLGSCP